MKNGVFGVPKGDTSAEGYDPLTTALRLIINMQPANEVQKLIMGYMKGLPLFNQWA